MCWKESFETGCYYMVILFVAALFAYFGAEMITNGCAGWKAVGGIFASFSAALVAFVLKSIFGEKS